MEITTKIGVNAILLFFAFFGAMGLFAQDCSEIDAAIFRNPVLVSVDPPKEIKGWTFIEKSTAESYSKLVGNYPAKILKFEFKGDAVGISVVSDAQSGIIEYSVDNQPWQKKDLYMEGNGTMCYFTLEPELRAAKHMLQLRLSSQKNQKSEGYKCVITQFYFNKTE